MTIELVTVPALCMECGLEYGRRAANADYPGLASHGYCPTCEPVVMQRWFGNKKQEVSHA